MMNLVKITISNSLDSSTRVETLVYCLNDVDAENNLAHLVDMHVDLNEWSGESVYAIEKISPINISTSEYYYNELESMINKQ
jgi:hypothetical protein